MEFGLAGKYAFVGGGGRGIKVAENADEIARLVEAGKARYSRLLHEEPKNPHSP